MQELQDLGTERALLTGIIKNGKDSFVDVSGIVDSGDFSLGVNRAIFSCIKSLSDDPNCHVIDVDSIVAKGNLIGYRELFENPKNAEYLELLANTYVSKENIPLFAVQVNKFSNCRKLYDICTSSQEFLKDNSGKETLSKIIGNIESKFTQFLSGNGDEDLCHFGSKIEQQIQTMLDSSPVTQIGIPSGFPIWDRAIGGGLRNSAITLVVARMKAGKSFDGLNKGNNVASLGIPVLYLDSELTASVQMNRLVSINSGIPLEAYETSKFKSNKEYIQAAIYAKENLKNIPISHQSIAGMNHTEALSVARRWITKNVGFKENGKANDCLIIYDYLKLTDSSQISKGMMEYAILGFAISEIHNFTVKYDIPVLAYAQTNREGINTDSTSVIGASDRLGHLASSISILRNKSSEDNDLGCGFECGNKKIKVLESRYGSGLASEEDYINIKASLKPGVSEANATGKMTEGLTYNEIVGQNGSN